MNIILNAMIVLLSGFLGAVIKPNAVSEKYDDYIANINEYYDTYEIQYIEKENFTIAVVEGICNEELSYGVFLGSIKSGSYTIKVFVDEKEYSLPSDLRKDTIAYCIKHPIELTYIDVYDTEIDDGTKRLEITLKYDSVETLLLSTTTKKGKNLGCSLTNMVREYSESTIIITIICICIGIIVISACTILYLKIRNKGVFNKEKKFKSDLRFFNTEKDYNEDEDDNDIIEINPRDVKIDNTVKNVYEKKLYYEDEDEEFDIKPFLEEKGYKLIYNEMTEMEKNEVMIYLMTLRDSKRITENQYHKESIKLWKK